MNLVLKNAFAMISLQQAVLTDEETELSESTRLTRDPPASQYSLKVDEESPGPGLVPLGLKEICWQEAESRGVTMAHPPRAIFKQ